MTAVDTVARAAPRRARPSAVRRAWGSLDATPTRQVPGTVLVGGAALLIGLLAAWYAWSHDLTLLYFDAQSHLTIARRILDNKQPGFPQIGTVWLPVPHLLLLPFVQSFALFSSGWAGSILGSLCLAVSAASLYRISARLGFGRTARLLVLAVFLGNPTVLYLHTTALTEPVLLACVLAMTSGLAGWIVSPRPYSAGEVVVFTGIPAALATLSRYDGWAAVTAAGAFVLVAARRRWGSTRYALLLTAAFAALPVVAMAWWVSYNAVTFGDPLSFMRGEYSAGTQQKQLETMGMLATKGNLGLSIWTYDWTVVAVAGAGVVVLALVGLCILVLTRGLSTTALLVWSLLVFYPFALVSLYVGQTAIRNDHTLPPGTFNIRFAVLMMPALAVLVGLAAQQGLQISRVRAIVVPLVLSVLVGSALYWSVDPAERLAILTEGYVQQAGGEDANDATRWLAEHYDGGSVLIDEGANPFLMQLGMPLREIYATFTGAEFDAALADPASRARWVVVSTGNAADSVWEQVRDDPGFALRYQLAHSAGEFAVYRRTDAWIPAAR